MNIRKCFDYCNSETTVSRFIELKKSYVTFEEFSTYVYMEPLMFKSKIHLRYALTPIGAQKVRDYSSLISNPYLDLTVPHNIRLLSTLPEGLITTPELSVIEEYESYIESASNKSELRIAAIKLWYEDQINEVTRKKQKMKISDWIHASKNNCLKSYFSTYDIFDVAKGFNDDFEYSYHNDYFDYIISTFTLKERALMYSSYLTRTARKIDYSEVDYKLSISDSYYISQSQLPQYEYAIDQFTKVALPSDGIGVASMYCIMRDIDYVSWEPNDVGLIARRLGIITSDSPILDESRVYLYFYCSQYYSLPMFLGQQFVVWDVTHMPKPSKSLTPEVSTNITSFSMEAWKLRYSKKYMLISSYYPLDIGARNMMKIMKVPETTLDKAQFLIATAQATIESLWTGKFYTVTHQIDFRKKINSLRELTKEEKQQELPINTDFINELKSRTLLITEKSFPFREIKAHRPGRLKMTPYGMDRHFGSDRVEDDGYMSSISTLVGSEMIYMTYDIVQGVFVIKMLNPSVVRHIRLKENHIKTYGTTILKVYMVATYKVKDGYLVLYVPDYELRPQLPVLVDDSSVRIY